MHADAEVRVVERNARSRVKVVVRSRRRREEGVEEVGVIPEVGHAFRVCRNEW